MDNINKTLSLNNIKHKELQINIDNIDNDIQNLEKKLQQSNEI